MPAKKVIKTILNPESLVVQHKLTTKNLRQANKMGGLPMPSVAIARADIPMQGYGDITLIGPKSMAKPSARNPVYSADAYSPTYPTIDYKFSRESIKDLNDYLADLPDRIPKRELYAESLENGAESLRQNKMVMAKFLKEKGESLDFPADLDDWKVESGKFDEFSTYSDPNPFITGDVTRERLLEVAQGRAKYEDYFPGAPQEAKDEWEKYLEDLINSPTGYFEAKPQRAVGLNEFEGAIVPADTPDDVLEILRNNGITRIEKYTDEAEVAKKVGAFQDQYFGAAPVGGILGALAADQQPGAGNYAAATLQGIGHMPKIMWDEAWRGGGYMNSLIGREDPDKVDEKASKISNFLWDAMAAGGGAAYKNKNILNPKTEQAKQNILMGLGNSVNEIGASPEGQMIKDAYNTLAPIYHKLPKSVRGLLESM